MSLVIVCVVIVMFVSHLKYSFIALVRIFILNKCAQLQLVLVPPGFAHGFLVLKNDTEFLYKTTDYYAPQHERCVRWDDPAIGIVWPLLAAPMLSAKDQVGLDLSAAEIFDDAH